MTGTGMLVLIVLIAIGFAVFYDMYKKHLEFKEKTLFHDHQKKQNDDQNNELKQKVVTLEERIQVLEKIVTDEGYSVQKDINNL